MSYTLIFSQSIKEFIKKSIHYTLLLDRIGKNNISLDFKMTTATSYIMVVCFGVIIIRLKDVTNKIRWTLKIQLKAESTIGLEEEDWGCWTTSFATCCRRRWIRRRVSPSSGSLDTGADGWEWGQRTDSGPELRRRRRHRQASGLTGHFYQLVQCPNVFAHPVLIKEFT